jgi:NADH-quinone oxidoreductase subunit L
MQADGAILDAAHHVPGWVKLAPVVLGAAGIGTAYAVYMGAPGLPARLAEQYRGLYAFLLNKWYFDELYDRIFVQPVHRIARALWQQGDMGTIDKFGPDGLAAASRVTTGWIVRLQTGQLAHYAFAMLIGVAVLVSIFWAGGSHG